MFKKVCLVLFCTTMSACSLLQQQPEQIHLSKPVRPILPIVQSSELECLSDETSFKIQKRLILLRQYSEQLETVIDSVNNPND